MTLTVEMGEPDFILYSYDVYRDNSARAQLHRELIALGAEMVHFSLYRLIYTPEGHAAILKLSEKFGAKVNIRVITPKFPEAQLAAMIEEHERNYALQFQEIEEKIEFIDEAYAGNKKNEKTKEPYTGRYLYNTACYAYYLAKDIQKGLEKRKTWEMARWKDTPEKNEWFNRQGLKLRKNIVYLGQQVDRCRQRKNMEEAQGKGQTKL